MQPFGQANDAVMAIDLTHQSTFPRFPITMHSTTLWDSGGESNTLDELKSIKILSSGANCDRGRCSNVRYKKRCTYHFPLDQIPSQQMQIKGMGHGRGSSHRNQTSIACRCWNSPSQLPPSLRQISRPHPSCPHRLSSRSLAREHPISDHPRPL